MQLNEDTVEDYIEFIDSILSANLPSEKEDLVKAFQVHSHSKTYCKYKNKPCRFQYGRYFTDGTIVTKPLCHVRELERLEMLQKRESILTKVSDYINNYLDSSKSLCSSKTCNTILNELEITKEDYYWALSVSSDNDYQIQSKCNPNSCFVNNYNPAMLKAWQANLDLQTVHNYYKALSYMASYISKSESQSSEAWKQAVKEIKEQNLKAKDAVYKLTYSFVSLRQLSVQEAEYHCLPELWFQKCNPEYHCLPELWF